MSSFLPEIETYFDKVDSMKFPHAQGLTDLTSSEIKKIQEHISNHVDSRSLRRFRATDYYLRTDFGSGDLYKNEDDEAIRGYAFKGSSRKVERFFKFNPI